MAFLKPNPSVVEIQRDKPLPELIAVPDEPKEATPFPPPTKREVALHELLSSERAYASDLALVREVHIPLALGTAPLSDLPSSSSSSSTLSAVPNSSPTPLGPPMTQEDVKRIFGNISEIAVFSDSFCQALEEAIGDRISSDKGGDCVGNLFLSIIPKLERLYRQYIIRHPTALNHLQELPQTPAIQSYFTHTQTITSSLSHAWDLPSLLIKPVQRLSQYPNLLTAIFNETPDSHPDKQNLRDAQERMKEVIRDVNEARRRAEVVRHVLMSKERKPASPNVLLSANLIKVKSLTVGGASMKSTGPTDETGEAMLIRHLERELQAIEQFVQKFARGIVEWARTTSNTTVTLHTWALDFAKVIGLSTDQGSDAFDAFFRLIERKLMPLCIDLEAVINDRVVKELARLLMIMTQPLKLLRAMKELEPYHYHLINMPVSAKSKPPPSLLAASTNYLALRGQLAAELPTYVTLLRKGLKILNLRLSAIQTEFWGKLGGEWAVLWEGLRLEEELNVGAEETVNVWLVRWAEVHDYLISLSITQNRKFYAKPTATSYKDVTEMPSTLINEGPDTFNTPLFPSVPPPLPIKVDSPKIRRRGGSEALAKIAIMQGQTTNQTLALDPAREPELRGEEREPSPTQPTLSPRNSASSFAPSFASSLSSAARQVMDEAALSATIMYMLGTVEPLSFLGSSVFRPLTPGADLSRRSWDASSYRSSLSNIEADSVGGADGEGKQGSRLQIPTD